MITNILSFALAFLLSCIFSYVLTTDTETFKIGKSVKIKNRALEILLTFPAVLSMAKYKKKPKLKIANIFGTVWYILNYLVLLLAVVMQFLPVMPCDPVSFGRAGRRQIRFYVDTYNGKIPMLSIWILVFLQFIVLMTAMIIRLFKKKDGVKKLGIGWLIFFAFIVLLAVGVTAYFIYLLF